MANVRVVKELKVSPARAVEALRRWAYEAINLYEDDRDIQSCFVQSHNTHDLLQPLSETEVEKILEDARDNPESSSVGQLTTDAKSLGLHLELSPALHDAMRIVEQAGPETLKALLTPKTSETEAPKADGEVTEPHETPGLRLVKAGDVEMKRVRWLWHEKLAFGKLNLFCGNPDHGKSLVSIDVIARATTGRDWPAGVKNTAEPMEVLIVAAEDGLEDTIAPRLAAAKANMSKVHYLQSVASTFTKRTKQTIRQLRLDEDIKALEETLRQNPAIRLVVIDPVSSYLGAAKMMDEQAVRGVLNPLVAVAERLGICVLTIMHLNKKIDLDAVNRVGGAMAFVGIPRLAWVFAKKPKDDENESAPDNVIYMMKLKGNIIKADAHGLTFETDAVKMPIEEGEDFVPYVRWTGTTEKTMDELATKKKKEPKEYESKSGQVEAWLLEYLSDRQPKRYGGRDGILATAEHLFNASEGTVKRVGYNLGVVKWSEMVKDKMQWFWKLKADDTVEADM
jgi:hypothetical protein